MKRCVVKKIDRFALRDVLSDGAAGTVYRAEESLPGEHTRVVALKVLPGIAEGRDGDVARERFFNEVGVLAQLAVHPHVVTVYAMGLTEGYPWLAMEFAEGTLDSRIGDTGAEPGELRRMMEQVLRGLEAMHGLEPALIHQDLKPGNVLVDVCGNYKITDFSLGSVVAANRTRGLATVRYAAPELLSSEFGKIGPWTDLYALGHMAYEMALGRRTARAQFPGVYEGNTSKEPPANKWMMWHASVNTMPAEVAEVVRGFPPGLSEVIGRLMAKSVSGAGGRYQTAGEVLADLAKLGAGAAEGPVVAAAAQRAAAPARVPPKAVGAVSPPTAAPPAASGGGERYWVRLRGKTSGPFDFATLQRQVKSGAVSRFHQVSSDQVNWKAATAVEGLYGPTAV
ncbi:MAG TPA: serine/threonine-protein kinase [Phycisphaerae bacterium]|nr:serine/threonine-protein kinase [Phycisphaerae bacterium]